MQVVYVPFPLHPLFCDLGWLEMGDGGSLWPDTRPVPVSVRMA